MSDEGCCILFFFGFESELILRTSLCILCLYPHTELITLGCFCILTVLSNLYIAEEQAGLMSGTAGKKFASSTQLNSKLISTGSPIITSLHHPEALMAQEQKVNLASGLPDEPCKAANGALASSKPVRLDQESSYNLHALPAVHLTKTDGVNMMDTLCENSLFSSSLSELFSRKSKLSSPFSY